MSSMLTFSRSGKDNADGSRRYVGGGRKSRRGEG